MRKGFLLVACCTVAMAAASARGASVSLVGGKVAKFKDKFGTVKDLAVIKFGKEPDISAPLPDPSCPTQSSFTLRSDQHLVGPVALDCQLWQAKGSSLVYKDPSASSGGAQKILLKVASSGGKLLIKLKGAHYGSLDSIGGPVDFVEAELDIGTTSYCGRFQDPPSTLVKNETEQVLFKGPSGPCVPPTDTPTPVSTDTATEAPTPVDTPTPTMTGTVTQTGTITETPTITQTASMTATPTETVTPAPPTAFRIDQLALRDPHVLVDVGVCIDVTDPPGLGGYSANGLIDSQLTADGDGDGFLDFNLLAIFRPLLQPPFAGSDVDIETAQCTPPVGSEVCSPGAATPQTTTYQNQSSGVCLSPVPGTTGPGNGGSYSPGVLSPAAPCAKSASTSISFPFGSLSIPLEAVQIGARYVGDPATGLADGLIVSFISEADANQILLPADFPLFAGQPLSVLLPAAPATARPTTGTRVPEASSAGTSTSTSPPTR